MSEISSPVAAPTSTKSVSHLPTSNEEMVARGWSEVDVVFVTGDAYVDHPSFATALLGRLLEAEGFRVAILAQPDWHSAEPWRQFGKPKLAFCVSAGNLDSMINHYTANRKVRNEDAYSPGGEIGLRPDRATLSYCQRAREAFPGTPVIAGGVEASLRRLTHYDYWSDKLKRSIVLDSKADLLVYGMGESPLLEILRRLQNNEPIEQIRDVRGTAFRLKKSEDLPEETETTIHLPSHEEAEEDKSQFSKMTRMIYESLNPFLNISLVQEHAHEGVFVNPPSMPLETEALDRIYNLPFTRKPHPMYGNKKIPAFEVIRNSVQIHRGCFGGCTFCSLAAHQGKIIQSRSSESIIAELTQISEQSDFSGTISDLGGPTANMYQLGCTNPEMQKECKRTSCLTPNCCENLKTDHSSLLELLQSVKKIPNIEHVFIASGIRTDLAMCDPRFVAELAAHHVGGHLKTAPEHTDSTVLALMNKPQIEQYDVFSELFEAESQKAGKKQFLVPYLMAGFPGTTLKMMVETAVYLKSHGISSEQVQEFLPGPFEWATSIYYSGLNPQTGQPVYVPRKLRERRLQKALLMYDDPNNYHDIKSALQETGREDLIGTGPECLIPPYPDKSLSLRQSARVRRFKKKTEEEKRIKTAKREDYLERDRNKQRPSRPNFADDRNRSERPRQFGDGNRSERPRQFGDGNRSERPRQFGDGNRSERPRQFGDGNRSERPRQFGDGNRSERPRQFGDGNRSDRPRQFGDGNRSERPRQFGDGNRSERPRQFGDGNRSERPRQFGDGNRSERPRQFGDGNRSDRPRQFGDGNRSERPRQFGDGNRSERPRQFGDGNRSDRPRQFGDGNRSERPRQFGDGNRSERPRQFGDGNRSERPRQFGDGNRSERPRQFGDGNRSERPRQFGDGNRSERPRQFGDGNRSERPRQFGDGNRSERPRQFGDGNRSERPRQFGDGNRSERPRQFGDGNRSERPRQFGDGNRSER
ncbi:MAG: YgiQ family radical SAM protein, partial [Thermoguttaceae bacterium]